MVRIGKTCTLEVVRFAETGAYLDGGPYGEILLPNRYVSNSLKEEDEIEVFISFDSEDRIYATTDKPKVMTDEFALLQVIDVNRVGAFLDWGLPKDLFVPFNEQATSMERGKFYLVYVYVDIKTGRIVASSKTNKFLNKIEPNYTVGQEVDIIIADQTDLGYKAIINMAHSGIIYTNEVFANINIGDHTKGYVKKIRTDGKIDLSLEKLGYEKVDGVTEKILQKLKENDGFLPFNDKSDPNSIQFTFGISKKTFKQAIGGLFKNRIISIDESGINLIKE